MKLISRMACITFVSVPLMSAVTSGSAQTRYETGATDAEIKIGNIMPYSGAASAGGAIGRAEAAYFAMINGAGGIDGRKINFITYDDAYSPPKAVEQARKLVEGDEVLFVFSPFGTPSNAAIQKYLNARRVPQLFVFSGASRFADPRNFPWTMMGWLPTYRLEASIHAKYLLKEKPLARIGVLYQNDDGGKDYLKGLKEALGEKAGSMIVAEESFDVAEPTIDTHIAKLKASGADTLIDLAPPKFAAQAIKRVAAFEWRPLHILASFSKSLGGVIKPAGLENAQGIISATISKDPEDRHWENDPGMKAYNEFLTKAFPEGDRRDSNSLIGYGLAQMLVQVLKQCGDVLTRENVMKQATNLKDFRSEVLLPGIKINTSSTNYTPVSQMQMIRLNGEEWEPVGDVISGDIDQ
ncbi:ABC-type branched-subunit amino acid transport system substrate-binding protein [Bradyrhizobium macuxiense]|uniref:ABC-type branched-subunit amino acid transport system substrate-binding protein n=1 Tax=Bradyrhizobium macuxiense TaxID=1755647 RepID=A0A560KWX3_9BRAD|nr:ABC transporter substrate-binding protein [Bradyrhizobium macuxiense]TWB87741.1 ABC-type branched-subunit amino acid transport system substrate-binding protein [Bradyrhizobium macuxiense]